MVMLSKAFSSTIFKSVVFIFLVVIMVMVYQRSCDSVYQRSCKRWQDTFTFAMSPSYEKSIIRDIDDRLEEAEAEESADSVSADWFTNRVSAEVEDPALPLSPEEHFGLAQLYQHGKFGRERNIIKARLHYEKAIALSEQTNHQLIGNCHLHIAQLFDDYAEEQSGFYMIYHYLEALKH